MDWLWVMATVVRKVRRRNAVGAGVWSREILFCCPSMIPCLEFLQVLYEVPLGGIDGW